MKVGVNEKRERSVKMALKGLRVVEMAGLAPAPFAGMILAGELTIPMKKILYLEFPLDFGAAVIRVDKPDVPSVDTMAR